MKSNFQLELYAKVSCGSLFRRVELCTAYVVLNQLLLWITIALESMENSLKELILVLEGIAQDLVRILSYFYHMKLELNYAN